MSDPIYIYVGTYPSEDAAKSDLDAVRTLYADAVLHTYDAAVVAKDSDQKVHVRRHEHSTTHAAWHGAAVGALVGLLFPPVFVASTAIGAGAAGLVGHLWHGVSRSDLKDLGDILDAGEASLVVISTTEFDHEFSAALKAAAHAVKVLDEADAKEFEKELKSATVA